MLKIHEDNYEWLRVVNRQIGFLRKWHCVPLELPPLDDNNKVKINTETVNKILNDIVNGKGEIKVLFSPKLFSFGYLDETINHQGSFVGNYLKYLNDDWEIEHDVFDIENLSVSEISKHIDNVAKKYPKHYLIAIGYHQPIPNSNNYWERAKILIYNPFDCKAAKLLGQFIN